MISRLSAISLNTFREAVRDRVLYNLIVFVLLLVASAPLFSQISIDVERLIMVNVGLSSISFFGVIIAILIGIGLVAKEIDKKTLYTILSRPVRRWEFIVGKYFGLLLTLAVNAALMTVGLFLAMLLTLQKLQKSDTAMLVAVYLIVLQFMMVTAITLLFSSFSTPVFSAIFSFALFVIGSFSDDLRNFAAIAKSPMKWVATGVYWLVPNFSSLNVISQTAHGQVADGRLVLIGTVYAVLYSGAVTAAAVLIFDRRNLK